MLSKIQLFAKSEEFKEGVELFRKRHKLEPKYPDARLKIDELGLELKQNNTVYFRWYKKLITKEEYKANTTLTVLAEEGKGLAKKYWVAFRSITPPADCLEITNPEELSKVRVDLRTKT